MIAIVLGAGMMALLPTVRLSRGNVSTSTLRLYFLATWLLLATVLLVPATARFGVPPLVVLVVAPWLDLRGGLGRLLGRRPSGR